MSNFTGTIPYTSSAGDHCYRLKVEYTVTWNSDQSKATIKATGYVKRINSTVYPADTGSATLTINGNSTSYKKSYNLNNNDYDQITNSKSVTINMGNNASKTFTIKLSFNGNRPSYNPNGSISKSITVTRDTYKIIYDANGGSNAPAYETKYHGLDLTLNSGIPTRSEYTFVGWGTSSTDTTANYQPNSTYSTDAGDTLYAIWKKTLTLTCSSNGGDTANIKQSKVIYNATTSHTFTIPTTIPTRKNYTFIGYGTSSTSTSVKYQPNDTITIPSDKTLYAIWERTLTLSFQDNYGIGVPAIQSATIYNATTSYTFTIPENTLVREGYTFAGWGTSSAATSASYQPGSTVTISEPTTLYSVWGEGNIYYLKLNPNGGIVNISSLELQYDTNKNNDISNNIPKRSGFEFLGWYTQPEGGVCIFGSDGICENDGTYWKDGICVYDGGYTLYAHWKLLNIAYLKLDGEMKLCYVYYKVDNAWQKAIMYQKINNKYEQSIV